MTDPVAHNRPEPVMRMSKLPMMSFQAKASFSPISACVGHLRCFQKFVLTFEENSRRRWSSPPPADCVKRSFESFKKLSHFELFETNRGRRDLQSSPSVSGMQIGKFVCPLEHSHLKI